jgi:hypothetical protein
MRLRTLPEKLVIAATLLAAGASGAAGVGCTSDHHVSPWGSQTGPTLEAFAPRADLAARLAAVDAETGALGLRRGFELRVDLPKGAGEAVIRGYDGQDVAGRPVHAVRVATPLGVVMAVGPIDAGDLDRRPATELVPALLGGGAKGDAPGAYRTGTDLNGDGRLDVVLRSEAGILAVWHFDGMGSGAYPIEMAAPPTEAQDLDEDGRVDFLGELANPPGDELAPRFRDVAMFAGGRYTDVALAAQAWHARAALGALAPRTASASARLRAALERAWHEILGARRPARAVLEELRRESVPDAVRATFDRHVRVISAMSASR